MSPTALSPSGRVAASCAREPLQVTRDHGKGEQKTIVLWSVPRSASTAFEKAFSRRPDTAIVHEPFTDCYYFGPQRRSSRYGDQKVVAHFTGKHAAARIAAEAKPVVFVKELAFQAAAYLEDDFLGEAVNTFLLRHPAAVMASLDALKPDFTEEEFGFTTLAQIWSRVASAAPPPIVVEGDAFRADPARVLCEFCRRLDLEFLEDMLSWERGPLRAWGLHEADSQGRWHRTLETSTGVMPPPGAKPELEIAASRRDVYERALEIYEAFLRFAI